MIKEFFNNAAHDWDKRVVHDEEKINFILSGFDLKDAKILDAGCGTGVLEKLLLNYSKAITAIDISENMIKLAKKKFPKSVKFFCKDLFDIEEKFDVVILYSVYPHILDKEKLCVKLSQILNKNGRFIIFHSESRDKINSMHNIKASKISVKLKPVAKEEAVFKKLFCIDKKTDNEEYFLISGNLKENG